MNGAQRRSGSRRARGVLLAILLGVALTAGAGEAFGRVIALRNGNGWSSEQARMELETLRHRLTELDWRPREEGGRARGPTGRFLHPYYGFEAFTSQGQLPHLATYMQSPEGRRLAHVAVIGGSVSCLLVKDGRERLVQRLNELQLWPGRPVQIHVLCQGGMKQPQQLNAFAYAVLLGWKPDLLINVDGFNEVALASENAAAGVHPLQPVVSQWAHLLNTGGGPESELLLREMVLLRRETLRRIDNSLTLRTYHSAALGRVVRRALTSRVARYYSLQRQYVRSLTSQVDEATQGPPFDRSLESVMEAAVRCWFESSISLDAICRSRGIGYLHVLQPTLHDVGSKPLTPDEVRTGTTSEAWRDGCRVGYPMLRRSGEELSQRGVHFLDASMLFAEVEETLYYDPCHYGGKGSRMLADAIAETLGARGF